MKRFFLYPLLILLIACLSVTTWALYTESGLRFVLDRVLPMTPLHVSLEDVQGRLAGPITLTGLEVEWPGGQARADRVHADWNPWALLRGEVLARTLEADRLHVEISTGEQPDEEPASAQDWLEFSLPIAIRANRLRISQGEFVLDGETLVSDLSLDAAVYAAAGDLDIRSLQLHSDQGWIEGHALLSLARNRNWQVDLRWHWDGLEYAPIGGHTQIQGRLRDLNVRQSLEGLVDAQLQARVLDLPSAPRWEDLQLTLSPLRDDVDLWPELLAGASVRLHSEGDLQQMRLSGEAEVPELVEGPTQLAVEGGWQDGVLDLFAVRLERADGIRLTGQARLHPEENLALQADLRAEGLRWPLDDEALVRLPWATLAVSGDADGYTAQLSTQAAVDALDGFPEATLDVHARWRESTLTVQSLQLRTLDELLDLQGDATVSFGDAGLSYGFAVHGDVRWPDAPPAAFSTRGEGDLERLRIDALEVAALDGRAEGQGTLGWSDGVEADFSLTVRDVNPGVHWEDWPGLLGVQLHVQASLADADSRDVRLHVSGLQGQLRDRQVGGELSAQLQGDDIHVEDLRLAVGQSQLQASGAVGEALDLTFSLQSDNLEDFHPDARGRIRASGRARGARETPQVQLTLNGQNLAFQQFTLDLAELDADVDVGEQQPSRVDLQLRGLSVDGEPQLTSATLQGSGMLRQHTLELRAQRDTAHVTLALAGSMEELWNWQGTLRTLNATLDDETLWSLSSPTAVRASPERAELGRACTLGLLGNVCVQGEWIRDGGWSGQLSLDDLDLEPLTAGLGLGVTALGVVSGQVAARGGEAGFEALSGGLDLSAGSLILTQYPDEPPLLIWQPSALTLNGDAELARAELNIDLGTDGSIQGSVAVGWNDDDPSLLGRLEAQFTQLALIAEFFPDLAGLQGLVGATVEIDGTVAEPQPRGEIYWTGGSAELPLLGLRPQNVEVRAQITPDGASYTAQATLGGGELRSEGHFTLPPAALSGEARLFGTDVLVANLPEAQVYANPDLTVTLGEDLLSLTGEVLIPRGSVTGLPQAPGGAIATSPYEVILGEEVDEPESSLELRYDIRVVLGQEVHVNVAGLRARLAGDLRAHMGADANALGSGEVRVAEGTFGAFGQNLTIEQGRLLFTNTPLDNPFLEIRAVRQVEEILVGAQIRGTLSEPEISIFSNPPMAQAEALSYLAVGKGLSDLEPGERDLVNSAANSLVLAGGNLLAREIGARLGLDQFAIVGEGEDDAELVVGAYLGPRLFISYGIGLFDAVNTFRVNYSLGRRWAIEAGSGAESWVDLIFGLER